MKKAVTFAIALAVALAAAFLIYDGVFNKETSDDFFAMDTYSSVKITGFDSATCAKEIHRMVDELDGEVLSRFSASSLISRINKNGFGELDEKTEVWINRLLDVCRESGGAFDFTLGAVSDLWSFGDSPRVPEPDELAQALSHSGYEKLTLLEGVLTMQDSAARLDLGAAGKGIALDETKEYLDTKRVKQAVVSIGGSVLLYGDRDFSVGIKDPQTGSQGYAVKLNVPQSFVSTSGGYERNFDENGKIYHHILDPKTGMPVDSGLESVTIVSNNGLLSDALSTACFVLGLEKGAVLADTLGCSAVFIDNDKNVYSVGLGINSLEIVADGYTLAEIA